MEKIVDVVKGLAQNRPLSEVLELSQKTSESAQRLNPITDALGDTEIHAQWRFTAAYGRVVPPQLDLGRMVREMQGVAGPQEARAALDDLSRRVNVARTRIATEVASEEELHLYAAFAHTMTQLVQNSPALYHLELPADDDGVNGKVVGAQTLAYDAWHIEYLITVVRLLALHANAREISTRARIERQQKGVDCWRELLRHCQSLQSAPTGRVYRRPQNSLSSERARIHEAPQHIEARHFVERYLGGCAAVEARLRLVEAQRREEVYRDVCERGLEAQEGGPALGAIIEAYTQAHAHSEKQHPTGKLTHHARFMRHFWLCRANLALARQQAERGDQEGLGEAVQRVEYVSKLHRAYVFDKRGFTVAPPVLEQYNPLILDNNRLFAEWDAQFTKQYGAGPASREFTIDAFAFAPKDSTYEAAVARAALPLQAGLSALRALLSGAPVSMPVERESGALDALLQRVSDGDSARLAILETDAAWITWLLTLSEKEEFIMPVQFTEMLRDTQQRVNAALEAHDRQKS